MENERQSSLPSSLLPHLYKAPNQPRDSGTRTTIDSDDGQSDVHQVSPIQFPYAPPRRIYPQTVQAHPQQQQRPFLPYDLDQRPVAGATHNVAHQQQFMYTDSLLPPSSSRPIMPVGRSTPAYSYPPLQPPASRQQLSSGTSTATRTSWNEGEPGPSSLHNHQNQHDSRVARHRRGESPSPHVPPHIDPFSRRTANYEHDPASFGHGVVRHNAERDPYFSSSLSGPPTIPQQQHQQQLQHPQQHPQHQSLSSYFTQQPQPHSQNYPNQQQHSQHQQYQQHQQHQYALSASQSLSQSRSQQHLLLPDRDNDTAGFAFHTEPQSYGGSAGYPSVNSLSLSTPSPHFPSSSSSSGGGEGPSSSAYTLYHHRSTLPNEPTHLEHRLNEHPSPAAHLTDPIHDRPNRIHELPRADRTALRPQDNLRPHHDPWYSTRASRDLKHGPLFSVVSPRNSARARMEGMSRIIPMDVDERTRERETELNRDRDMDWEMAWDASVSTGGGVDLDATPGEGQGQVDGGSGAGSASTSAAAAAAATISKGSGGGGRRNKAKTSVAKRRRADVGDVDELARQSKGAAVQQGYRHDQKVWQVEEAQAKRPKKTLVACHFCRGRKLRCDGARPSCSHCVARGLPCEYAKFARRRGPGKAPRGARAKKNAEARAVAEGSVVFKGGVDPAGFKVKLPVSAGTAETGTRGRKRKGGAASMSTNAGSPGSWPASLSLAGMSTGRGGMVQDGAALDMGMDGMPGPAGARLPVNSSVSVDAVADEHEYELEMLAPEVRPYASVLTLDTLGPPSHQEQHQRHTLHGYGGGAATVYGATETGASSLSSRMGPPGISGAAGGTAAGDGGDTLHMSGSGSGSIRRGGGGPAGAGMSSSLSVTSSGGQGSISVSGAAPIGAYGFAHPSPAPHYPPAPQPDLRYDATEQARVFRDGGGEGDGGSASSVMSNMGGMQGLNMSQGLDMTMDMSGSSGLMGETRGGDGGEGGPGSASAYNYSRERTVTRKRSPSAGSEAERNE